MEVFATYEELNAYIALKVKKPLTLGIAEGGDLKVCYTQRVLIKDVTVPVRLHFEKVTADSVVVEYKGALGIDSIISGALSFIMKRLPEYSGGIIPEEGHRIRVDLTKIKKAKTVVENIALRAIIPTDDGIRVHFALKV